MDIKLVFDAATAERDSRCSAIITVKVNIQNLEAHEEDLFTDSLLSRRVLWDGGRKKCANGASREFQAIRRRSRQTKRITT